jgi:hypothetical protein
MEHNESLNSKEFAATVRVEAQTIRRSYCVNGHYLGIKPLKLPNGRLLWPKTEVLRVLGADR